MLTCGGNLRKDMSAPKNCTRNWGICLTMVLGTAPQREPIVHRPREVVSGVGVNCLWKRSQLLPRKLDSSEQTHLEETQANPDVHGDDVEVMRDRNVEDGAEHRANAEDDNLERMCVLCRKTERRAVFVVDLVNVLVERAPVQCLMREEMPGVLHDEENRNLPDARLPVGERNLPSTHVEELGRRVEEIDEGQLYGEVGKEQLLDAVPLLCCCRDLGLVWG